MNFKLDDKTRADFHKSSDNFLRELIYWFFWHFSFNLLHANRQMQQIYCLIRNNRIPLSIHVQIMENFAGIYKICTYTFNDSKIKNVKISTFKQLRVWKIQNKPLIYFCLWFDDDSFLISQWKTGKSNGGWVKAAGGIKIECWKWDWFNSRPELEVRKKN